MDFYTSYKPLRNYLRQFSTAPSLMVVWALFQHLSADRPMHPEFWIRGPYNVSSSLRNNLYAWELDTISRELILNAGPSGRILDEQSLFKIVNLIRELTNTIAGRPGAADTILREVHRIVHLQFPWQRPISTTSLMRNHRIFSGSGVDAIFTEVTGLTLTEFYNMGVAVAGALMRKPGILANDDYSVLEVDNVRRDRFFSRIAIDSLSLRSQIIESQSYDDSWPYAVNPLRSKPLLATDPHHPERLICSVPDFVLRRVSEGVFYDIAGKPGFQNSFGRSFEEYAAYVTAILCPPPRFSAVRPDEYRVGKQRKDGVDLIISDSTANVFVECKTKRLRVASRFASERDSLDRDLNQMAEYIVQNYKNMKDILDGRTEWPVNNNPCYPLVVTLEPWWIFTPALAKPLENEVKRLLELAHLSSSLVSQYPYTIASIDEFETALQAISQLDLNTFFAEKTTPECREWSVAPFATTRFGNAVQQGHRKLFATEFLEMMPAAARPLLS